MISMKAKQPTWSRIFIEQWGAAMVDEQIEKGDKVILSYMVASMRPGNFCMLYPSDIGKALHYREASVYAALKRLEGRQYLRKLRPGYYEVSSKLAWRGNNETWSSRGSGEDGVWKLKRKDI